MKRLEPSLAVASGRRAATSSRTAVTFGLLLGLLGSGCALVPVDAIEPPDAADAVVASDSLERTAMLQTPARLPRPDLVLEALPEPPVDLVDRIRRNFELPQASDDSIARELAWFASHPEYIERVFNRSQRYLHHIAGELERRGMPADLALLPIVESAYDPFAYSHGRASGLWQIIPGTGRRLGLEQNWWYDGRRDIVESTRAALDYLELLHEQFDGDWLLAVAGYNSGEGNVARAVRRARNADRPIDFFSIRRDLPVETRTYVPRLLAIRDLVADPAGHALSLPEIEDQPFFAAVDTAAQIDMSLASNLAGIELDDLYALNPGVNRWATSPDGPHRLLVPVDRVTEFSQALAELGERERVQWTRHLIRSGETLSDLALRYQTTPAVLRELNDLRGSTIRAGSYLMIPHATESMAAYSQSLDARTSRQQNQPRAGERRTHRVSAGESFWTISRRYKVGVRELASWNAMAPGDTLSIGKELAVWPDDPLAPPPQTATNQIRRVNYVVRRGDSLSSIAGRFRVTVPKLLEWNSISASGYLQPGQRLVMFVDVTEQSS
jgi:membrane-bound lytic murein transglycosylase D